MPITLAAYELAKKKGLYTERPGFDIAIKELTNKPPTANSQGPAAAATSCRSATSSTRSSRACGAARRPRKQALDEAVKRGNEQLERFQKANQ